MNETGIFLPGSLMSYHYQKFDRLVVSIKYVAYISRFSVNSTKRQNFRPVEIESISRRQNKCESKFEKLFWKD